MVPPAVLTTLRTQHAGWGAAHLEDVNVALGHACGNEALLEASPGGKPLGGCHVLRGAARQHEWGAR